MGDAAGDPVCDLRVQRAVSRADGLHAERAGRTLFTLPIVRNQQVSGSSPLAGSIICNKLGQDRPFGHLTPAIQTGEGRVVQQPSASHEWSACATIIAPSNQESTSS
jgi:hypothetical protein